MENPTQDGRPIQLIGPLEKDKLLLQTFSGQEGISIPFHFDLLLLSTDFAVSPRTVIGKSATIMTKLPGEQERFINGIVTSFTQSDLSDRELATYQATLAPQLWMLTRNADCRIFQGQTVPQIIEAILKENNALQFADRLTSGRYQPREYCVQYSETDFHFISRLMEEEGIFYFFEHAKTGEDQFAHTMVLADDPAAFKPVPMLDPDSDKKAEPKAEYRAGGSAAPGDPAISSWSVGEEVRPDMYQLTDFNFEDPTLDLTESSQTGTDATLEIYDFPGNYTTKERGQQLVDVRMEEIETAKTVINGSGSYRAFTAGCHFSLTGHFRKDLNAKSYLLTSVFHCFKQGNVFRSSGTEDSSKYINTFQCIPHPNPYRPPRTTRLPVIPSTQTAIVVGANTTDPDGNAPPPPPPHTITDEIYTDKYGRVKVRFHWDRTGKLNGDNTCFIRVAHAWAGSGWGHQWIPRIGQEVVVTFLEGNPDRPLITGVVYNAKNPLPFTIPDCKNQSGIRTHGNPFDPDSSKERWHMLRFDDRMDHEQIFLRSEKRLDIRALGSYFDTCGGDRNTLIGWKDDKGQGGDYNITAGNDHQIHIQGGRYDRVEKVLNLTVVGDAVFDYEANQSTMVTEKSELNAKQVIIEASEKISLKVGSSFVLIEPGGVTIVGQQVKINSGGSGIATGDPDIEDPLDASPADTGKPCNRLYVAHRGGGGGGAPARNRRTLNSQHAPEVPPADLPPGAIPCCTITSQTVATSPANRARVRIGVGEEVDLTVSPGPATWAITSGNGTLSPAGAQTTVRFTAGDRSGRVTITATGAGCTCNITFSVVEPVAWTMKRNSGVYHTAGHPDCGWKADTFIHPNDVNFYRINTREVDSQAVTTGSYASQAGEWHGHYPLPDRASAWFVMVSHTDAGGTKVGSIDLIYSGYPSFDDTGTAPPFNVGTKYYPMTHQWKVGTGAPRDFPHQVQDHEIFSTGRCESRKGSNTEAKMYNDPASGY